MQNSSLGDIPAYLAIQPFLMRTSGVAGVNFDSKGTLFRVDRNSSAVPLTAAEEEVRVAYQKGYALHLGLRPV
jgi:hypothetical protein